MVRRARRLLRSSRLMPLTVAVTISTLLSGASAHAAGTLYGFTTSTNENPVASIYALDELTGTASFITDITGYSTGFVGLEFLRGRLYATDVATGWIVFASHLSFGSIDVKTGAFTEMSNQDGSFNWQGLAANQAANLLYTIDIDDNLKLKAITPAGATTSVGTGTGVAANALAYDDVRGILYATSQNSLYVIDTATGTSHLIGSLGFHEIIGGVQGLAMDGVTGVLYLNNVVNVNGEWVGSLYTVDVTTGTATLVGPNGVANTIIDGVAWAHPIAEPQSLWMLFAASVGFLAWRRRVQIGGLFR